MPEERKPAPLPPEPPACPRCAALEGEVARLKTALAEASEIDRDALETSARRMTERDSARALLRELAAATRRLEMASFRWSIAPSENTKEDGFAAQSSLQELVSRAEAEAGEENADG